MNTLEGRAWLALAAARGVGPRALWRIADVLLQRQKTASWLLRNPAAAGEALRLARIDAVLPDPDALEDRQEPAPEKGKIVLLHPLHPAFPRRVRDAGKKLPLPALLYASGSVSLLDLPAVSIVGRRAAGFGALAATEELASRLAARTINVTSGYASGIDSAAHLSALRSGGTTTIVLAEGLGRFQVKRGFAGLLGYGNTLVLSPFPFDAGWTAFQAMARNKLVAALCDAMVVVLSGCERDAGGRRSGTFDAGMSALALGRPLFVVDPSFFSPEAAGNRELVGRGGLPWDPAAGPAPVLEAVLAASRKKAGGQKSLF
ncbi:MAG: DNA-processing protein DprA [Candidatus Aminicenantes bacterium]|nr:DNA-processing protein DprA [Candidatus Aminicenantes bacterium]